MNVLVLGGHGFIGSHVVEALVKAGHKVTVYSRRAATSIEGAYWIKGDFTAYTSLSEALEGMDMVVHAISATVPSSSAQDPMLEIDLNLATTVNLLQSMQRVGVRRLVFISSGGTVYGNPTHNPVVEAHPLNPISNYGVVKVAIEKFIGAAAATWGLKSIILRPSNPFGVGQGSSKGQGLISTLLDNLLAGRVSNIYGDGSIVRDYLYVSDLAALILAAVESDKIGVFNAGSGKGHSISQLIDSIERVVGRKVPVHRSSPRDFDVREIVLNSTRACETFDWMPKIDLESGIALQYEWLKVQY